MRDVLELLLVERYGPSTRPDRDTPDVIRKRQRVLADMPGDEHPPEAEDNERE